ncbi:MAG: hypothetical protein JXA42_01335 [Anaerolineales bacterium]|nr:hypothetical protein [Anaerolineales bacterium]
MKIVTQARLAAMNAIRSAQSPAIPDKTDRAGVSVTLLAKTMILFCRFEQTAAP